MEDKRSEIGSTLAFLKTTSETVEKGDFGSPVLLRDPNFLVCHIWKYQFQFIEQICRLLTESCATKAYFFLGFPLSECILKPKVEDFSYVVNHAVE